MRKCLIEHDLPLTDISEASANEWKKARHFDEKYWLYVVTGAGTDSPQIHKIQNPAYYFRIDEDIFATGFILPEEKWQSKVIHGG